MKLPERLMTLGVALGTAYCSGVLAHREQWTETVCLLMMCSASLGMWWVEACYCRRILLMQGLIEAQHETLKFASELIKKLEKP